MSGGVLKFTRFEFTNFRGMQAAALDLTRTPGNAVHVLVGLNESGKTTILEGIDLFRSNPDLRQRNASLRRKTIDDYQAMIPINQRAHFDGKIIIKATLKLTDDDAIELQNEVAAGLGYAEAKISKTISIAYTANYSASKFVDVINLWYITIEVRKRKGSTPFKALVAPSEEWIAAIRIIELRLPKVMYFPTHLLEFPDRISLEQMGKQKTPEVTADKNSFYYAVLDDVLKAIDPRLSIETHILKRLRSKAASDQQNVEALIQRVEQHLNTTILGEWRALFGQPLKNKQFRLFVKMDANGLCHAEIKLSDGAGLFSLNERSAGFRWFFAFIMLVTYRAHRSDQVLFLFDEPAANLHPRAQAQLLNSFAALSAKHQFIYTTHSHYLINPLWLESTFVVKNDALERAVDPLDIDPNSASITITPYRTFVGSHQDQQFYYKPIMDALEYSPSKLAPSHASVLIEGKTDYYCLEYFRSVFYPNRFSLALFPGGGSGSLDSLVSLLSGWGLTFLMLLDADAAGQKEKKRYEEKFERLVDGRIVTLGDLAKKAGKYRVEEMFTPKDKELIRREFFPDQKVLSKKLLHRAVQELLSAKRTLVFEEETTDNFSRVLTALQNLHDELLPPRPRPLGG
jgi:predicted ATP-dependent endonuclease of OLD family